MCRYIETRERRVIRFIGFEVGSVRERGSSLAEILHHNKAFVLGMTGTIDFCY